MTMLIVDDDAMLRKLLSKQLELLGFPSNGAQSGVEALQLIENGSYKLIFLDIMMPQMNGYEAARAIRAREQRLGQRAVPIVAMTAHVEEQLCIQAGMTHCLQKPVDLPTLCRTIQKWFPVEMPGRIAQLLAAHGAGTLCG